MPHTFAFRAEQFERKHGTTVNGVGFLHFGQSSSIFTTFPQGKSGRMNTRSSAPGAVSAASDSANADQKRRKVSDGDGAVAAAVAAGTCDGAWGMQAHQASLDGRGLVQAGPRGDERLGTQWLDLVPRRFGRKLAS